MAEAAELLRDLRQDIAALRQDVGAARIETARLAAETLAARRDLELHRADDRRELDDHEQRLRSLARWRWTVAGSLTLIAAAVGLVATPVIGWMVG